MNVVPSKASAAALLSSKKQGDGSGDGKLGGGGKLNLYHEVPQMELSLDQFEVYALKRLKVRALIRRQP